jgi:hypothetical protein
MKKVAVQMFVSLDGVMEAPENWTMRFWSDDHAKYAHDQLLAADALLLGRDVPEPCGGLAITDR